MTAPQPVFCIPSDFLNGDSLGSPVTLLYFKFYSVTFCKRAKSLSHNTAMVDKDILSAFLGYKPVPFSIIEPFYFTARHKLYSFVLVLPWNSICYLDRFYRP